MNTDAIWTGSNPLTKLAESWEYDRMEALHLLVPVAQARGHGGKGDWDRDENGRLTRGHYSIYACAHITRTDRAMWLRKGSRELIWDQMI